MPAKKTLVVSGKRKTASARAVVRSGVGRVYINHVPVEIYEPEIARAKIMEPLLQAGDDVWKQLDLEVKTSGGGYMGQAEAACMAIANAILKWTKSTHLRTVFAEYDRTMIAGDSRKKETKKFGGPGLGQEHRRVIDADECSFRTQKSWMKFFVSARKLKSGKRQGTFEIKQGKHDGRSHRGCHCKEGFQQSW